VPVGFVGMSAGALRGIELGTGNTTSFDLTPMADDGLMSAGGLVPSDEQLSIWVKKRNVFA